jgi:hypothetical protein
MQVVPQTADDEGAEEADFEKGMAEDHHNKKSSQFITGRKQKRPPGNVHIAAKVSLISQRADGNASRGYVATCC